MIALYLLAAHFVGDYLFQTRWQAAGKFGFDRVAIGFRTRHVVSYSACFIPIAAVYAGSYDGGLTFVLALAYLHWVTDAQRIQVTLGDVVGWRFASPESRSRQVGEAKGRDFFTREFTYPPIDVERNLPLPPSPWEPLPILIDQTLHFVQIAVLAGLLLR